MDLTTEWSRGLADVLAGSPRNSRQCNELGLVGIKHKMVWQRLYHVFLRKKIQPVNVIRM